ncbi:MAG: protein kinase, partial [Myxococcota bacterium]
RDLKASNVFLSDSEGTLRVVLFDFGIAKLLGKEGPKLTLSSSLLGSPACMSPEQILGHDVDARTDIYALGSLTYQMLVGHPPFAGASSTAILTMHLEEYPPYPSHYGDVSPAFDEITMKAMSKEPDDRYQTVAEFATAFDAACHSSTVGDTRKLGAESQALGVFVGVHAAPDILDDPDDALLDDLESVVPAVTRILEARNYILAYERGNSALFVMPLPTDTATARQQRKRELSTALSVLDMLHTRPTRDTRVSVYLHLHVAEATLEGQRVVAGPLLDSYEWTPELGTDGLGPDGAVLASEAALDELGMDSAPLTPSSSLRRVRDPLADRIPSIPGK